MIMSHMLRSNGNVRRWAVVILLFSTCLALFGSGFSSAAYAASEGPGLRIGGVFVGAFITTNNLSNAYCVEPDGDNPASEVPATEMTRLRGYRMQSTGHEVAPYAEASGLRRMNYITSSYGMHGAGNDWQNAQAAAVALAVWTIRGEQDGVVAAWVANLKAIAPADVQALTDSFLVEAEGAVVPTGPADPADPRVTWTDDLHGTVELPEGYAEFRIESGGRLIGPGPDGTTFDASATETALDPTKAHAISFESLPSETSSRRHRLTVRARWSQSVTEWPARVWGFQPSVEGADQLLIGGGGGEVVTHEGDWRDTIRPTASSDFAPQVSTEVTSQLLGAGEPYVDRVTFGLAPDSAAWPQYWENGGWHARAVRATGTLYGPLTHRPEEQADVPEGVELPIAGTAVIEATDGPGSYDAEIEAPNQTASGYYTWVWKIDGADQGPQMQTGDVGNWHLASGYQFQDAYGQSGETHLRPMNFSIRTQLTERTLPAGGGTIDTITIDAGAGEWLEVEGDPVPVTFRATVYEIDGTPTRAPDAPRNARIRATERVTVTDDNDPFVVPVRAALARSGGVTVQVCVLAEDQAQHVRDLVVEECDDWGIPAETARIVLPKVTTLAQEQGVVDAAIHDTAKIAGLVPEDATLGFTAYLRPEAGDPKYNEKWEPVRTGGGEIVRWSAAELARLSAQERCLAQPVASTIRMSVEGAGTYTSPAVIAQSEGTIRWVEDLGVSPGTGASSFELHRGRCGADNETTQVVNQPTALSTTGGPAWGVLGGATAGLLAGGGFLLFLRGRLGGTRSMSRSGRGQ